MRALALAIVLLAFTGCERITRYSRTCDVMDAHFQAKGTSHLEEDDRIIIDAWQVAREHSGIVKAKEVLVLARAFRAATSSKERLEVARALLAAVKELKD